jgi:hypothetical protein
MSTTSDELQHFYEFAQLRIHSLAGENLDSIYAEWRASNPLPDELEVDVRAVQASLRDLDTGVIGRLGDDFASDFRRRNGILNTPVILGQVSASRRVRCSAHFRLAARTVVGRGTAVVVRT